MSTTVANLRAMHVRLAEPERWTKYAYARDAKGKPVMPNDPTAVCWCLDGAAEVVVGCRGVQFYAIDFAFYEALKTMGTEAHYPDWQDRHTHAEMLTLIDRAIELTEAAQ